jgi:hypothetical protein
MAGKAQKAKGKTKSAAKRPAPVKKPGQVNNPKVMVGQAKRVAARQDSKTEPRPHQASPAPVQAVAASESFLYKLTRFFWLLFHPGKTNQDFAEYYRNR